MPRIILVAIICHVLEGGLRNRAIQIGKKEKTNMMYKTLEHRANFTLKKYHATGFSIFPLRQKEKRPLGEWKKYQYNPPTISELDQWEKEYLKNNWAIVTGKISGIVVIDIDNVEAYQKSGVVFPETPTVSTGKGFHLYFKHPGILIPNGVQTVRDWFDVRGDGGYVVAPPSIHPNGNKYKWVDNQSPWDINFAALPKWLIPEISGIKNHSNSRSSKNKNNSDSNWGTLLANGATEGGRNDAATRLAGHYIGLGLPYDEVLGITKVWNHKNNPPLSDNEITSVVKSIYNRDTHKPGKQYIMDTPYIKSFINEDGEEIYERSSFKHTILADVIRDEIPLYRNGRYFFFYDQKDGLWKQGAEDKIKLMIAEKLGSHANNSRVSETYNQVVRITPVDSGELPFEQKHPFKVNLKNGVLDLMTGEFTSEYSPHYFQRIKLPIFFDLTATCEGVNEFLSEVLQPEDIPFINELAASILAKTVVSPALVFLLGSGGNGKSKLLNLLGMIAGQSNTSSIPMDTLQNDRFASAELYMKLFNYCGDIGDGYLAQTDVLKSATGGDPLYAQFKGKDPFKFTSFAVQAYSANSEPKFKDLSKGMKDRIFPVRMDKKFRGTGKEKIDPLAKIDDNQLSGWLNQLVVVFQDLMKRQGRYTVSEGMLQKRDEWFETLDIVGQFIKEECIVQTEIIDSDYQLIVSKKELFASFQTYLIENGYTIRFTKQQFEKRLFTHGITDTKKRLGTTNPIHCYIGISLSQSTPF